MLFTHVFTALNLPWYHPKFSSQCNNFIQSNDLGVIQDLLTNVMVITLLTQWYAINTKLHVAKSLTKGC